MVIDCNFIYSIGDLSKEMIDELDSKIISALKFENFDLVGRATFLERLERILTFEIEVYE